ncbi:trimethylguanosine synthase-like, partial [Aphis craccivora]
IDIEPNKIRMARHNAKIYGVAEKIEFIVGDIFLIYKKLKADVLFMSLPWGVPEYSRSKCYSIKTMCNDHDVRGGFTIFDIIKTIDPNIAFHMPKNTNILVLISVTSTLKACTVWPYGLLSYSKNSERSDECIDFTMLCFKFLRNLSKTQKFAIFYVAEIIIAIQNLHSQGIINYSHLLELIVLEDAIEYILGKDHEIPLYASPEAILKYPTNDAEDTTDFYSQFTEQLPVDSPVEDSFMQQDYDEFII